MSTLTLPQTPTDAKPEPPPIVAMLRKVADATAARNVLVVENLRALCRTLDGRK